MVSLYLYLLCWLSPVQVNLNVDIQEGNVMVNNQRLPFAELTTMEVSAEISE